MSNDTIMAKIERASRLSPIPHQANLNRHQLGLNRHQLGLNRHQLGLNRHQSPDDIMNGIYLKRQITSEKENKGRENSV